MRCRLLLPLVVITLACSLSSAEPTVVSKVKVHNPGEELTATLIRGVLPLPIDYDKPIAALALRGGGKVLPTQVSVLSTYPGSDARHPVGRPETVQLVARVPSLPAGAYSEFEVVELDSAPKVQPGKVAGGKIAQWLRGPDGSSPVVVEATDAFGHRYAAAPIAAEHLIDTLQAGPLLAERVYQAPLTLVGEAPAGQAIKQFMHVRAYLTTYADEEFASLVLMIHNGSIDNPNGHVYYRDMRVGVPESMGLEVWYKKFSPASGSEQVTANGRVWQPCPAAHPRGKVFIMRHNGAAVLRTFVYAPKAKERMARYAKVVPIFVPVPDAKGLSWSNFATARYGANNYPLPFRLGQAYRSKFERKATGRQASMDFRLVFLMPDRKRPAGQKPPWAKTRRLGHAMPAGVRYGGMTGGSGIDYTFGVEAAITGHNPGIYNHVILADRHWDRHWANRFYDDGQPYIHSRHVVVKDGKKYLQADVIRRKLTPKDPACKVQADHVKSNNLLSAEAQELLRYMIHDDQHLSRVFDAVPAAYLACDPVSRDRLVTLGSVACATMNVYPNVNNPARSRGLVGVQRATEARPGKGLMMFGRAQGWLTHSLANAFYLSRNKQIRADCLDVARAYADINVAAQMAAGNITIHRPYSKAFKGQYTYANVWQSVGIMGDGARCIVGMLSTKADQPRADKLAQAYARQGKWAITKCWNESGHGPAADAGLQKVGTKEWLDPPYLNPKSNTGGAYIGSPYAWYYEISGDKQFLDRLVENCGGDIEKRHFRPRSNKIGNWVYPIWLAQGGKIPGRQGP